VRLEATDDVETYAAATLPFLESEPCSRNVLRWLVELARDGGAGWSRPSSFWWIEDEGAVAGAATWNPPFNLLVSSMPDGAAALLASAVVTRAAALQQAVNGVTGPKAAAGSVASAFSETTGTALAEERLMLLHELRTVSQVVRPDGSARRARESDVSALVPWMLGFWVEVGYPAGDNPEASLRAYVDRGLCYVWESQGSMVSMASHAVPLAGVVRVTTVYTPAEQRNRGYARRLVAEISAHALAMTGVRRCMLFADAANPVSNSIYHQIGYAAIEEHADIHFAR
jgi:predicted GNAT family acetyltransferase